MPPLARHVRPVLLGGSQVLFMRQARSSETVADGVVVPTPMLCSRTSAWISTSEISALAFRRASTRALCGSRMGRQSPSKRAGAGLPLWRRRRISFAAADGLTSKRKAACRMEGHSFTVRTIRSRKSRDGGAGMGCLLADRNQPYGISSAHSTRSQHALISSTYRIPLVRGTDQPFGYSGLAEDNT